MLLVEIAAGGRTCRRRAFAFLMQARLARRALVRAVRCARGPGGGGPGAAAAGLRLQHRPMRLDAHQRDAEPRRRRLEPVGARRVLRPGDAPAPARPGRGAGPDPRLRARSCFRPPAGQAPHTLAIKFRSQSMFQAEHFHARLSGARPASSAIATASAGRGRSGASCSNLGAAAGARRRGAAPLVWPIMTAARDFALAATLALDADGSVPASDAGAGLGDPHRGLPAAASAEGCRSSRSATASSTPEVGSGCSRHCGLPECRRAPERWPRSRATRRRARSSPGTGGTRGRSARRRRLAFRAALARYPEAPSPDAILRTLYA